MGVVVRVIDNLELQYIAAIPAEQLVDPNCRFIPMKETKMDNENDYSVKGFLSEQELHALEMAVTRAKDMLAPETHERMTRALWELHCLRSLGRELLHQAAAAGLIEHAQVLRSREAKVSPHQPCA